MNGPTALRTDEPTAVSPSMLLGLTIVQAHHNATDGGNYENKKAELPQR